MAGAQRTLLTLLANIDRSRFEPYLLVPSDGELGCAAKAIGITVFVRHLIHWVPGVNAVSRQQRFHHLVKSLKTLRARSWAIAHIILRNQIDLVYTNTVTCVEGAVAARMTGKPHVWHIHEYVLGNSELTPLLPFRLYSWSVGVLSKSVIFCSDSLAKSYPTLAKKATVVHNGLPFPAPPDRARSRGLITQRFGIDPAYKIVAVVSALHPRKDHFTFLETANQILQERKDIVFLLVGEGSESHTKLIRDRIKSLGLMSSVMLTGWWPSEKIHELLAALDVLVISSEQESFGLTIIEALAVETPVVSTRCGGPEEVIKHGVTGLLVQVRDSVGMAAAIVHLLQNPQFARNLGEAGRQDVLLRFGVERYAEGVQQVMQQAISKDNSN